LHVPGLNHYAANELWHHNSGKSHVGAFDLLAHTKPGDLAVVAGPTYRQLSDATMRSFVKVATQLGLWDESKYRKTDNQAILNNGVEILFRSSDNPASNRGPSLHHAWLDEAGLMQEDMFNVMVGRLRGGGKQGTLTATFTPQGKDHWTYRLFADKQNPLVKLFYCSTKDNPFIAPEIYQNLLYQYGKGEGGVLRAQQELEGQFVCVQGAEWDPSCFSEDLWFDAWPEDCENFRFVTLDSSKGIGGRTGDYSAFIKLMHAKGLMWVEADLDNVRNTGVIAARAIEIQRDFDPDWFGIEKEFGGDVLIDDLEQRAAAAGIDMNLALIPTRGIQKDVRIRRLTRFFMRRMFRFRRTPGTRLLVQQAESWPHSAHEDGLDSLDMAVQASRAAGLLEEFGEFVE
jgi:PBSX family phage terminase large subunit